MLRADNRAYDYNRLEYEEQYQLEQPNQQTVKKPQKRVRPKIHLLSIIFAFSLSIFIISRYAYIAEINFKINELEKDYQKALKENTDLNVQLMKTVNLETLEKEAIENLHMQYPDVQNQVVYVNVQNKAASDQKTDSEFYKLSDVQENRYIAYTKAVVGSILKVLD